MFTDALLNFIPIGGNLSLVGAAGVPIFSNVIDLLGLGQGVAPSSTIIGNATTFGEDAGVGGLRPELNISIGTAVVAVGGTLMKIALQAAADPGAAGNYTPAAGAWQDVVSQDNIAASNLTAGAVPFRAPWIPTMPPGLRPRFLRLWFGGSIAGNFATGQFSAGTIGSALVTTGRDDYAIKYAAKNYTI